MAKYRPNLHIPNPLPYVDGQKLGEFLRSNPTTPVKKSKRVVQKLPQRVNRGQSYY